MVSPRSCPEHVSADGGGVAEDADTEDDDHRGGQLGADAELVAQEDDQRRDDHVGHERDDEHLGVEDPVEAGAQAAEDGVQGGHHGDRQVRLENQRHRRVEEESQQDAGREADDRDHAQPPGVSEAGADFSWLSARATRSSGVLAAGRDRWSSWAKSKRMSNVTATEASALTSGMARKRLERVSGSP